jgi:hypothetical protein
VIGIDGRGGAGKSTLAERFRRAVPNSAVVHTDDVAWNHAISTGELPFMLREKPWSRATLIAAGPAAIDHDADTELVVASSSLSA